MRRRDRVRLRYGVGCPARLSASDCCSESLMEYSYYGPLKGKTLMITTERGPADEVEFAKADSVTAQARHGKTQVKKLGQHPQAVIVLTELMSLAQAKREMGIVKEQTCSEKERKGQEASVSQKHGFYFDLGLCASVTKR